MAQSPTHRWGQIIGDLLESAIEPFLADFAMKQGLYLDRKGPRPTRGLKVLVIWVDANGNAHRLDYVMERGGSAEAIGRPVAFIEIAWRRYTKHSRAKAQEIQGAVEPLLATHREAAPFFGAVLAGEFTPESLQQLASLGCTVAFFPYETVLSAFGIVGIDASTQEDTPDELVAGKVRQWESLSQARRDSVRKKLVELNSEQLQQFAEMLAISATRAIERVRILVLHGTASEFLAVGDAITFIEGYDASAQVHPLARYEIQVRYNNGTTIDGAFVDQVSAIQFLRGYLPPTVRPATEDEIATIAKDADNDTRS